MFSGRRGRTGHNEQMGFPSGMVTLLFTDIADSGRGRESDRETVADALARHDRIVRERIEVAGGQIFNTLDETFRAVFADPSAALASAVAVQRAVSTESWPSGFAIRVRMALHSGACVERDGDYFGPVVHCVARLHAGIGFEDLGEHHLMDPGPLSECSR
jgi:class 3 adenylate cyclase